jgi:5-methylcytosine-specific restriction protein A
VLAYWLLQFNPAVYNLEAALESGGVSSWSVARYLDEPGPGDELVLWSAGPPAQRGVRAIGRVTGAVVDGTLEPDPYWTDRERAAGRRHWLPIEVTTQLARPVRAVELLEDRRFASAAIIREYQSGNPFRLSEPEWNAIMERVSDNLTIRRNPPWARDEIILALDLYLRRRPQIPGDTDAEVSELSEFLNRLPIHTARPDIDKFRSPSSVALKLANFLAIESPGKGLAAGSRLDREVWEELAGNREQIALLAAAIRVAMAAGEIPTTPEPDEGDMEALEGRLLYRQHRVRERDARLVKRRKELAKTTGILRCEICSFDFASAYGTRGQDFIEAHHILPMSEAGVRKVRPQDLALVCSNCHSMLHRRPWATPDQLRATMSAMHD